MKYLFLVIFYSCISFADLSDGMPKYTIQVFSHKEMKVIHRNISKFRKYGYAFSLETTIKCSEEKCESPFLQTNRIYLNIFKTKEDAFKYLKNLKKENPKLFNDAIVQNLVE